MECKELGFDGKLEVARNAAINDSRVIRDRYRDGYHRLSWPIEEKIRRDLEALLETFDLNPDDIIIIVDDTIDIIAAEIARATSS